MRSARDAIPLLLLLILSACADTTRPTLDWKRVASVAVSPTERALRIGDTLTVVATPRDASGTPLPGRAIAWESDAASVATISSGGVVTAVAPGLAHIAAVSEGKRGISTITVTTRQAPVATVTVAPTRPLLEAGDVDLMRVTVVDSTGQPVEDRVVTWTTSDPNVATVSATGTLVARRPGPVTVTATSEGRSGTAALVVSTPPSADLLVQRYVVDTTELVIVGTATGSEPIITRVGTRIPARRPAVAPDGHRIAFAVSAIADGVFIEDLFAIGRDGTGLTRLTSAEGFDDMPTWSPVPGSDRIAFVHSDAATARTDIWVMRGDGSYAQNLTHDIPGDDVARGDPAWSPNGQWIAFTQNRATRGPGRGSIWLVRADGSAKRQITLGDGEDLDLHPSWSPDGSQIVFTRGGLAIVSVPTGVVERIPVLGAVSSPSWSPDGRHIAFAWQPATAPSLRWDVYTVRPDGSDMRRRATEPGRLGSLSNPTWIRRMPEVTQ
jgi:Tol biopolymer transport system component